MRSILFGLFFLIFIGCNEDKEFLAPSPDKIVIDVTHKDISLDGEIVGEPIKDIEENESHSLTILPLDIRLRKINPRPSTAHIHIGGLNSFHALTRTFITAQIFRFKDIKIALGRNFKDTFTPYMFKNERDNNHPCRGPKGILRQMLNEEAEVGMTADEKYQKRIKELEKDHECAEKYIEFHFTYFNVNDSISFAVSLNEIGVIGAYKYTKFSNEKELWEYIEEIHSRGTLQNKIDKDEIMFIAKKNATVNEIAPYLIRFSKMGYEIKFATMN